MLITVGFIKEAYFIARTLKISLRFDIFEEGAPNTLSCLITQDGILDIWYKGNHIWKERISGESSFFGVESCDSVSRIVACIDNQDPSWQKKYYFNEKDT